MLDRRAQTLAAKFWPGPLTLVLPRRGHCAVSLLCSAGLDSLAVRVPGHPVAQALLERFGRPLAAPSANRSGQVSPTRAEHVADSLGERVDLILDGGPCPVGLESTVLDLTSSSARLLRPGALTAADIADVIGPLAEGPADGAPKSPGLLASHYAPELPLRLEATAPRPGEALLAFGPIAAALGDRTLNLSEVGDLREAAANLFAHLRALDCPDFDAIAVMAIPRRASALPSTTGCAAPRRRGRREPAMAAICLGVPRTIELSPSPPRTFEPCP